jgi:hypothetical protein
MKKSNLLLAGSALLSAAPALATDAPDICKTAVNYAVQAADLQIEDGSFAPKYDPSHITMAKNFKTYPIAKVTDLGNCDSENSNLKESWCRVGGGSPEVYQIDVNKSERGQSWELATVVVTVNRGGCWVDELTKK